MGISGKMNLPITAINGKSVSDPYAARQQLSSAFKSANNAPMRQQNIDTSSRNSLIGSAYDAFNNQQGQAGQLQPVNQATTFQQSMNQQGQAPQQEMLFGAPVTPWMKTEPLTFGEVLTRWTNPSYFNNYANDYYNSSYY